MADRLWELRPSTKPGNGTLWRDIVNLAGEFSPEYVGEALEPDAILMVAAPEMLETLEAIELEIDPDDDGNRTITPKDMDRIRAVIRKAKGEPACESTAEADEGPYPPGYPGPCPDGMDWSEWLALNNVD